MSENEPDFDNMAQNVSQEDKCDRCICDCYYCGPKGHNSGAATCVFGHASYCMTRKSWEERREARQKQAQNENSKRTCESCAGTRTTSS